MKRDSLTFLSVFDHSSYRKKVTPCSFKPKTLLVLYIMTTHNFNDSQKTWKKTRDILVNKLANVYRYYRFFRKTPNPRSIWE